MNTLLLRLSAPLQSWGSTSLYDNRETDYYPTKSGVIGMLAAALGRKRDADLSDLAQLQFGVRIDAPGKRLRDFQVTEMKERFGKNLKANVSNRIYLSDATFLVGFSSEDKKFLKELQTAVRNPKFTLFLGRRSCPPTIPLDEGIKNKDLYHALLEEPWLMENNEYIKKKIMGISPEMHLRIIIDDENHGNALTKDVPISFSPFKREYEYRSLKEMPPKVVTLNTKHDPMSELR